MSASLSCIWHMWQWHIGIVLVVLSDRFPARLPRTLGSQCASLKFLTSNVISGETLFQLVARPVNPNWVSQTIPMSLSFFLPGFLITPTGTLKRFMWQWYTLCDSPVFTRTYSFPLLSTKRRIRASYFVTDFLRMLAISQETPLSLI